MDRLKAKSLEEHLNLIRTGLELAQHVATGHISVFEEKEAFELFLEKCPAREKEIFFWVIESKERFEIFETVSRFVRFYLYATLNKVSEDLENHVSLIDRTAAGENLSN